MSSWRIRIRGRVQGVGFRPFVWKAAVARGLTGLVSNGIEGVTIDVNADEAKIIDFQEFIYKNPPRGSRISEIKVERISDAFFDRFSIIESPREAGEPSLSLTPDTAMCEACREDIRRPDDRRYHYAFATCTYCGPRYSVMRGLPYDRIHTSMADFRMCEACQAEYEHPADRRFYAQTNSCPQCGVALFWNDFKQPRYTLDADAAAAQTAARWREGGIVAIKGIGGYLLTCDAANAAAVMRLRARKRRASKPFALMYPDIRALRGDVRLDEMTAAALRDPAAPIVLLEALESPASGLQMSAIAPGLTQLGVMLPYAPLFELLLSRFGKPIVATSGNYSQAPIVYKEADLEELSDAADFALEHNRAIVVPQDDSLLRFAGGQPIILRRSRGLAPAIQLDFSPGKRCIAALGAEMKSTFTFNYSENLFVSQYWGDLSDWETQTRFEHFLQEMIGLFKVSPELVVGDMHPDYFSTRLGETLSAAWNVPFRQVQHHEAHFAAVLAENKLIGTDEPTLGVIWDGTGFGADGHIWGGEFFIYEKGAIRRVAHLPLFPALMGDKMAREPRISALALFGQWSEAETLLSQKFDGRAWSLYPKVRAAHSGPYTASMGRIFDAVASLIGLADACTYEGEAALYLEDRARRYCQKAGAPPTEDNYFARSGGDPFSPDWLRCLLQDVLDGKPTDYIAAAFHVALAEISAAVARHFQVRRLAFSGGVFQNALLTELLRRRMPPPYQLFFHRQMSPNDENISFGQWAYTRFFA